MGLRFKPAYLKHICNEVWPIVLWVVGLVVSLVLGRVLQRMEGSSLPTDALLYAATVQQVFGTVVVLWGLIRLRVSFGLRRLREYPLGWLRYLRLEPPRDCRRLHTVRGWRHAQIVPVFPRST